MNEVTNSTLFVVAETGEVMTIPQIMAAFPDKSIPVGIGKEGMFNAGFIMVMPVEQPVGDVVTRGEPVLREDGYYDETWTVRDYTPEEAQAQFENARTTAVETIGNLRYTAIGNGAPLILLGKSCVFSLVGTSRQDYKDFVTRARSYIERGLSTTTRVYDKSGASHVLTPQQVINFGYAVEDQYFALFEQAEELLASVMDATVQTGLPTLPEALTVQPIEVQ